MALIIGLAIALPLLTGQQRPALALTPELLASIYFEGISPALRESLERGEHAVEISPEVEKRILQAVPDGSEIGHVIEVNGTYHALVMIEKGLTHVRLAEVILKGEEVGVVEFAPISARHLFEVAFVETVVEGGGGVIGVPVELGERIDLSPEMKERILREVPPDSQITAAWILDGTYRIKVRFVEICEVAHRVRNVMVILDGDKVEVTDFRLELEMVVQWELIRGVLFVTLVEGAAGEHIWIPQEAQERILQEVGGEIIFAMTRLVIPQEAQERMLQEVCAETFKHIYRALVRIEENGERKYVQVILEGDKVEIGVAEVEYVEYIEPHR